MKIINILFLLVIALTSASAAVFVLGDNLNSNGDGAVTGNSPLVESTGLYRQDTGASGNPSGYNAIMVGSQYGGTPIWRAVTSFDLSGLPAAPAGFTYNITDVTLILEVSGGTNDLRPATLIDFYEGSFETGTLPASSLNSVTFDSPDGTFVPISLGPTLLDLSSDSVFTLTMDAPNAANDPGNNFYTFGSGLAPNNIGFTGTGAVEKAPELQITFDLVPVPEPTTFSLVGLSFIALLSRRKRS